MSKKKKFKNFLIWTFEKKSRMIMVLTSIVVLLLTLGFIGFMLLSGYDKEKGLYKTPVDTKIQYKKGN